jgi:hypothetical protein
LSAAELDRLYRRLISLADSVGTIEDATLVTLIEDAASRSTPAYAAPRAQRTETTA